MIEKYWKNFLGEKRQDNGPVSIKKDRKSNGSRQKNERGGGKVESNDSPEIPDRGRSDIPGLPSGTDTKFEQNQICGLVHL